MSLSRPTSSTKNPSELFIKFSGKTGKFNYWDSTIEKQQEMDNPEFLVVENDVACVSGYHDASGSIIYSNEISKFGGELSIKARKGGEIATGKWRDIKDKVVASGGRYTRSIYAVIFEEDQAKLVNIRLVGSACKAWMDFEKETDPTGKIVSVSKLVKGKKGATSFNIPIFATREPSEDELNVANDKDHTLQNYFDSVGIKLEKTPETLQEPMNDAPPPSDEDAALNELMEPVDLPDSEVNVKDLPF